MSEVMTRAIIRMPYARAMSGDMTRRVFYARAQFLLEDNEAKDALIAELINLARSLGSASVSCESFHHAKADQHDHSEDCPPMRRYEDACLRVVAIYAALSNQGKSPC